MREYIWLPEAEIAPTAASRATIDRPIAVVDGVNAAPATYYVHTDHLHRPIRMSSAAKSIVWSAEYQPWGAVQSLSGALTLDLRFPGQWFQLEAGLHYNWHRHYDASLGRYTQPDPLGFVDGPSVYGYARNNPYRYVDPDGRLVWTIPAIQIVIETVILPTAVRLLPAVVLSAILGGDQSPGPQQDKKKRGVEEWNKRPPPEPGRYTCRYVLYFDKDACDKGICPPFVTGRGWHETLPGAMSQARQEAQSKIPPGCVHQHHGQMWCRHGNSPPFNVRQ